MVIKVRECSVKSLHRDSPVLSNIGLLPDRQPTTLVFHVHQGRRGVAISVRIRFRIECLISADVADNPGALVGESCEGQSLPYVQYFLAVYFVAEEGVAGCVRRCTIRGGQRLRGNQCGVKGQRKREHTSAGMSSSK